MNTRQSHCMILRIHYWDITIAMINLRVLHLWLLNSSLNNGYHIIKKSLVALPHYLSVVSIQFPIFRKLPRTWAKVNLSAAGPLSQSSTKKVVELNKKEKNLYNSTAAALTLQYFAGSSVNCWRGTDETSTRKDFFLFSRALSLRHILTLSRSRESERAERDWACECCVTRCCKTRFLLRCLGKLTSLEITLILFELIWGFSICWFTKSNCFSNLRCGLLSTIFSQSKFAVKECSIREMNLHRRPYSTLTICHHMASHRRCSNWKWHTSSSVCAIRSPKNWSSLNRNTSKPLQLTAAVRADQTQPA